MFASVDFMLPTDTLQSNLVLTGNTTSTFVTVPSGETYTVLYAAFTTDTNTAAATLTLNCGTSGATVIFEAFEPKNYHEADRLRQQTCTAGAIQAVTTGFNAGDKVYTSILYVPRDRTLGDDPSVASNFAYYTVVVLAVVAGFLFIDFMRRVFANR